MSSMGWNGWMDGWTGCTSWGVRGPKGRAEGGRVIGGDGKLSRSSGGELRNAPGKYSVRDSRAK